MSKKELLDFYFNKINIPIREYATYLKSNNYFNNNQYKIQINKYLDKLNTFQDAINRRTDVSPHLEEDDNYIINECKILFDTYQDFKTIVKNSTIYDLNNTI